MADDICVERVCNFTARCQTGPFIEYIPSYAVDHQFQDVVFLCKGGMEFVTHRNIIAAVSNFVANLIQEFRREVVYISFPDVEASDMKTLFNLLCSGGTTVNSDQLVEIIDIITFLGIRIPNVEISSSSLKCSLDEVMKVADDRTSFVDLNNDSEDETTNIDIQNCQPSYFPTLHSYLMNKTYDEKQRKSASKSLPTEPICNIIESEILSHGEKLIPDNNSVQTLTSKNDRKLNRKESQNHSSHQSSMLRSHLLAHNIKKEPEEYLENTITEEDEDYILPHSSNDSDIQTVKRNEKESVGVDAGRKTKFSARNKLSDNVTEFKKEQEALLEEAYSINEFPSIEDQKILADELKVSKKDVKNWFANRRAMGRSENFGKDMGTDMTASLNDEKESGKTLHEIFQNIIKDAKHQEKSRPSKSSQKSVDVWIKKENEENSMDEEDVHENQEKSKMETEECPLKITGFSKKNMKLLESLYKKDKNPSRELIRKIARQTRKNYKLIATWFAKKRLRDKIGSKNSRNAKSSRLAQGKDVTTLTEDQECHLEAAFRLNEFPSIEDQKILADELHVSKDDIKCWFANRRAMERADGKIRLKRKLEEESGNGLKLTEGQRKILEQAFRKKRCPSKKMLIDLADELGVRHSSVVRWFRCRQRKADRDFLKKKNKTEREKAMMNRSIFNDDQRAILEVEYERNKFPTKETLRNLSEEIGFPIRVIHQWFGRTRFKEKRMAEENGDDCKSENATESEEETAPESESIKNVTIKQEPIDDDDDDEQKSIHEEDGTNIDDPESSLNLSDLDLDISQMKRKKPKTEMKYRNGPKFTEGQRKILEEAYHKKKCPSKSVLNDLADELGVRSSSVMRWFRCRQRKTNRPKAPLPQKIIPETDKYNRSIFTDEQRAILEEEYEKNKFPRKDTLERLSEELGFSAHVIHQWFGRTRFKEKRMIKANHSHKRKLESSTTVSEDGHSRDYSTPHKRKTESSTTVSEDGHSRDYSTPDISTEFVSVKEEPVDDEYETTVQENVLENDSMSVEPESSMNVSELDGPARENVISDSEHLSSHSEIIKEQRNSLKQAYMKKKDSEDSVLRELANKLGLSWFGNDKKKEESDKEDKLEINKTHITPFLRTVFTEEHKNILFEEYKKNKFPTRRTVERLSDKTGLDTHVIYQWFSRTRLKEKKEFDGLVHETVGRSITDDDDKDSAGQEDLVEIQITSETDHLGSYKLNIERKSATSATEQQKPEHCARTIPYHRNESSFHETVVNVYPDSEQSDAEDPFADNSNSMDNYSPHIETLEADNTLNVESYVEQVMPPDTLLSKEDNCFIKKHNNNLLKEDVIKKNHYSLVDHLAILKREYCKNKFLSRDQLKQLSDETGRSTDYISQWFRRTRYRERIGQVSFHHTSVSNTPEDDSLESKDVKPVHGSNSFNDYVDMVLGSSPTKSELELPTKESNQISESVTSVAETIVKVYPDVEESEDSLTCDRNTSSADICVMEDESMKVHNQENQKAVFISGELGLPTRKRPKKFNNSQRAILEEAFQRCNYLSKESLDDLSSKLNVRNQAIMQWFTRKRYRINLERRSMELNSNATVVHQACDVSSNEVKDEAMTDDEDSQPLHIVINPDQLVSEEKEPVMLSLFMSGPVNGEP